MGPPPDPEHMISMMENPQFASTMNEALQNPQVIDQMIQSNPLLRGLGPQVREAIQDPNFRRMLTDPAMMRQLSQMTRRMNSGNGGLGGLGGRAGEAFPAPGITDTTPTREGEGTTAPESSPLSPGSPIRPYGGGPGTQDPLAALLQAGGMGFPPFNVPSNPATPQQGQGQDQATSGATPGATNNNPLAQMAQNPIFQNPALMQQFQQMQQMLNRVGAGGGGGANDLGGGAGNPFNPLAALFGPDGLAAAQQAASPPPPADNRPPEVRYEEQLRQLNDMGFYEFDRNIEALRRAGGSVQGAVEYLLTH